MFAHILDIWLPKLLEKSLKLQIYNRFEDSEGNIKHIDNRLDYYNVDRDLKW